MRKKTISDYAGKRRNLSVIIVPVLLIVGVLLITSVSNLGYDHNGLHNISHSGVSGSKSSMSNLNPTRESNVTVNTRAQTAVNPNEIYKNEPAPMGIADFGIGPNGVPYSYNTTSFMGTISLTNLSTYNQSLGKSSSQMGFQLNVNLFFKDGGNVYAYWVQDVADFNTSDNSFYMVDNIWNMSSTSANMHNSTISGSGTIGNSSSTKFYYYVYEHMFSLTYPAKLTLQINTTTSSSGLPEIEFMFNDGNGMITYDKPIFLFTKNITSGPFFLVDGKQFEPDRYSFYDAELIMGGPGGGTKTTDVYSNVSLQLQYWNGMNYQYISNAYNFGSDTAEGICNVVGTELPQEASLPLSVHIQNGTGKLGQVYNAANLSFLHVYVPFQDGSLVLNGNTYNFSYGKLNLTLPYVSSEMSYELYNSSGRVYSSNISIGKGQNANLEISKITIFENFSLHHTPSNFIWYILINGKNYSTSAKSIVLYLPYGDYNYTVGSNYASIPIANGVGTVDASSTFTNTTIFFAMSSYKVTFNSSGLSQGITWGVSVHNISSKTAVFNATIEFYLPNGSYMFSIQNVSGYSISSDATGSFLINGTNLLINISFTPISQPLGRVPDGRLIGYITPAIIVAAISVTWLYYRKKK